MKWITAFLAAATLSAVTMNAEAQYSNGSFSTSGYHSRTIEPYAPDAIHIPDSRTIRRARKHTRLGGLMLGIGWAVPAITGLFVMDAGGDVGLGARMLIPFYGWSEVGLEVADTSVMGALFFFTPTIVQVIGTGFLISGISNKRRVRRFAVAPILQKEGGGLGLSFSM